MMRKWTTWACVLALILTLAAPAGTALEDFTDAGEIADAEAVTLLAELGVLRGEEDGGAFLPDGAVSRAEMAKMICIAKNGGKGTPDTAAGPFSDTDGHWAEGYITYCADLGIVAGMGDGTFAPNDRVTAGQMEKMLLTALGYDADVEGLNGTGWLLRTKELTEACGLKVTDRPTVTLGEASKGIVSFLTTPQVRSGAAPGTAQPLLDAGGEAVFAADTFAQLQRGKSETGGLQWTYRAGAVRRPLRLKANWPAAGTAAITTRTIEVTASTLRGFTDREGGTYAYAADFTGDHVYTGSYSITQKADGTVVRAKDLNPGTDDAPSTTTSAILLLWYYADAHDTFCCIDLQSRELRDYPMAEGVEPYYLFSTATFTEGRITGLEPLETLLADSVDGQTLHIGFTAGGSGAISGVSDALLFAPSVSVYEIYTADGKEITLTLQQIAGGEAYDADGPERICALQNSAGGVSDVVVFVPPAADD